MKSMQVDFRFEIFNANFITDISEDFTADFIEIW